jgi:hypothetical protein
MELRLNPALGPEWFRYLMKQEGFAPFLAAVEDFPRQRRAIEAAPESPERAQALARCDRAESMIIPAFTELLQGMCSDPWATLGHVDKRNMDANTAVLQRVVLAHVMMAVFQGGGGLAELRQMLCPDAGAELQGDFEYAVWEGKWAKPGPSPVTVTRQQTHHGVHQQDGKYNTWGRLDPVAMAGELDPLLPDSGSLKALSEVQLAFLRDKLFEDGRRAGLKKSHARFLARLALDGAKKTDNPAAWRAIRDRKRGPLLAKVREILDSL